MEYLLTKVAHIVCVVAWFAVLFYLPRLFVYAAQSENTASLSLLSQMQRRLYLYIGYPSLIGTYFFGILLLVQQPIWLLQGWLHIKLSGVFVLTVFHVWCGLQIRGFFAKRPRHGSKFYRLINELPTVLLIGIVTLVVLKIP